MADFRSDTVTQPCSAMRQAMAQAQVGDDVFADDPTVNQLQQFAAAQLGFEAALFAPSGTQTNLIAMMTHCQRGDEAIVGQYWHTYRWEGGGMAVLGSIQPQPLEQNPDGTIPLAAIRAAVKPDDPHFARTKLVVMENTTGGKVLPLAYMQDVAALCKELGLKAHIDGARLMNAAAAVAAEQGIDVWQAARALTAGYDSVSLCLSKGLGAPVGSLLLGSHAFIQQARRVRKMLGGGMRQAGVIAAAGLCALQHNVDRLADDHRHAAELAAGIAAVVAEHPKLAGKVLVHQAHTNILFTDIELSVADALLAHLTAQGIRYTSSSYASSEGQYKRLRWVTHLDIQPAHLQQALNALRSF
ncbi:low-specificity L-threonine aldolase [Rheinheimera marina]|uniref:Low-specificity L-threonine aldolase n=1 Tax=Rheinheimera marina TaxID=1774958 RepID=A0ABV9JNR7_9GAMM